MVEEASPDNGISDLPEWEAAPKPPPAAAPRAFQFSMGTLLTVIAAYSLLFGLLRWAGVRSVGGFAAIVIYVTAIALTQWSPLGGRSPYWASYRIGGLLGAVIACISAPSARVSSGVLEWIITLAANGLTGFFAMGILSFGVGGLLDAMAIWIEILCGIRRTRGVSKTGTWPWRTRDQFAQAQGWSTKLRLLVQAILVVAFALALAMMSVEERLRSR